jgi:hypothetical protein
MNDIDITKSRDLRILHLSQARRQGMVAESGALLKGKDDARMSRLEK